MLQFADHGRCHVLIHANEGITRVEVTVDGEFSRWVGFEKGSLVDIFGFLGGLHQVESIHLELSEAQAPVAAGIVRVYFVPLDVRGVSPFAVATDCDRGVSLVASQALERVSVFFEQTFLVCSVNEVVVNEFVCGGVARSQAEDCLDLRTLL